MDIEKRQKLKVKSQKFPDSPGVYLMKDKSGEIIYIGKAASLRKRVSNYFDGKRCLAPFVKQMF